MLPARGFSPGSIGRIRRKKGVPPPPDPFEVGDSVEFRSGDPACGGWKPGVVVAVLQPCMVCGRLVRSVQIRVPDGNGAFCLVRKIERVRHHITPTLIVPLLQGDDRDAGS